MAGFEHNGACIAAYLELFQSLSAPERGADACAERWRALLAEEAGTPEDVPLSPRLLKERFALSLREFLLVMAALALEMDGAMRGAFRTRFGLRLPTLEYGLALIEPICPSGVEALAELAGPNVLTGLLTAPAEPAAYSMERPLILCRSALAFLTGLSFAEIPGVAPAVGEEPEWLPLHQAALSRVREWYAAGTAPLFLLGPEGSGRRTLLRRACGGAVCVDLEEIGSSSPLDRGHIFREAAVTAILASAPICATGAGGCPEALRELERLCRRWHVPLAVLIQSGKELSGPREVVRLPRELAPPEREAVWRALLPRAEPDSCPTGSMTAGAAAETARLALRYARAAGRETVAPEDARRALRSRSGALEFAVYYDVSLSLEEMVLPENVLDQLRSICSAAQYGGRLTSWGLPQRREGVTAVFHGPSGTGKTMAASAIAGTLGLPLLRADLSQLMDKYVGETEKHLARLLQTARENRCVLFFDEADALFGRRAEVSSGHDRYANLSTSFLLQEIEQYDGVALLSTNLLSHFDEAFLRRLHYIVRFALPDAALREALWRRALPPERLEGDIPYAALARAELSPARINAAARSAAVEAAAAGRERVDAAGLVRALHLELDKNGKPLPSGLKS